MRDVLMMTFEQTRDLDGKLCQTGDAILIEESDFDSFCGIGKKALAGAC